MSMLSILSVHNKMTLVQNVILAHLNKRHVCVYIDIYIYIYIDKIIKMLIKNCFGETKQKMV